MMRWTVAVCALEGGDSIANDVARRLVDSWAYPDAPEFKVCSSESVETATIGRVDAVVVIARSDASQSMVIACLTALDEAGLPVMALIDGEIASGNPFEFAGALVEPITSDGPRLVAELIGMLHRQRVVKQMRREMSLAQRFSGGLEGEIAKMHEELQLAAMVQREFLPRELPKLHGVDFAALWRPTNYVSGDIYDVTRLDEDHVGVFIADAVGHGVPAALMTMVICRSLFTKEVLNNGYRLIPPGDVLARLNHEMILRQGRTTRFATAAYALVDCRARKAVVAGAGHPPPLKLRGDGGIEPLETSGGLLGVFDDEKYDEVEIELALGDRLLFYSDGFEQAFPSLDSDAYKRKIPSTRYRDEFSNLSRLTDASEMVDVISRKIDDQRGSLHQVDDLTLVCLHAGSLCPAEPPLQASAATIVQAITLAG